MSAIPRPAWPRSLGARAARAVAGAALGTLVGAAVVSAHGGDESRIHACRDDLQGGYLTIVAASEGCPSSATPSDWNIAGPSGAEGEAGPAGAAGAAGAAGPSGAAGLDSSIPLRIVVVNSGRPGLAFQQDLTAKCRAGEHVVAGGYDVLAPSEEQKLQFSGRVWANHPSHDGTGWRAVVFDDPYSTIAQPWGLSVFAACTPQGAGR